MFANSLSQGLVQHSCGKVFKKSTIPQVLVDHFLLSSNLCPRDGGAKHPQAQTYDFETGISATAGASRRSTERLLNRMPMPKLQAKMDYLKKSEPLQ